jgi:hypothetical protein
MTRAQARLGTSKIQPAPAFHPTRNQFCVDSYNWVLSAMFLGLTFIEFQEKLQ